MSNDTNYISERIIPAVMPNNFNHLESEMRQFISHVPLVQIDVMDGKLTESKSWPYNAGSIILDSEFLKIVNQEEGFPFWEHLNFEVDLMVTEPAKAADQWIACGATRVIVHYESAAPEVIVNTLDTSKQKGVEVILAVGLETSSEILEGFFEKNKDIIDGIQFMGIEKIGFQGQPFDERVIERIQKFHEKFPEVVISVDGGVNTDSAGSLVDAGASRLVIGSALKKDGSVEESIADFDSYFE